MILFITEMSSNLFYQMMKLVAMIETIKSKTGQLPEQYLQRLCWQSNASSECVD
jgi:hypothetical protein